MKRNRKNPRGASTPYRLVYIRLSLLVGDDDGSPQHATVFVSKSMSFCLMAQPNVTFRAHPYLDPHSSQ